MLTLLATTFKIYSIYEVSHLSHSIRKLNEEKRAERNLKKIRADYRASIKDFQVSLVFRI